MSSFSDIGIVALSGSQIDRAEYDSLVEVLQNINLKSDNGRHLLQEGYLPDESDAVEGVTFQSPRSFSGSDFGTQVEVLPAMETMSENFEYDPPSPLARTLSGPEMSVTSSAPTTIANLPTRAAPGIIGLASSPYGSFIDSRSFNGDWDRSEIARPRTRLSRRTEPSPHTRSGNISYGERTNPPSTPGWGSHPTHLGGLSTSSDAPNSMHNWGSSATGVDFTLRQSISAQSQQSDISLAHTPIPSFDQLESESSDSIHDPHPPDHSAVATEHRSQAMPWVVTETDLARPAPSSASLRTDSETTSSSRSTREGTRPINPFLMGGTSRLSPLNTNVDQEFPTERSQPFPLVNPILPSAHNHQTPVRAYTASSESQSFKSRVFPELFNEEISLSRYPTTQEEEALNGLAISHSYPSSALGGAMIWSISDSYQAIITPQAHVAHFTPKAEIGHVHIHRNRQSDDISIWLLVADAVWENVTDRWSVNGQEAVYHPLDKYQQKGIVLDRRGEGWKPSWITLTTWQRRARQWAGLQGYPGANYLPESSETEAR